MGLLPLSHPYRLSTTHFKNVWSLYIYQLCSLFCQNQINHINIKCVQRHPIHNENRRHFLFLVLHKYVTLKNQTLRGKGVDNKKGWIPLSPPPTKDPLHQSLSITKRSVYDFILISLQIKKKLRFDKLKG